MVTVKVDWLCAEPTFETGELVELDCSQFDDNRSYIVMVTQGNHPSGSIFRGVIVYSEYEDDDMKVGHFSTNFGKSKFVKFSGKITMEQV